MCKQQDNNKNKMVTVKIRKSNNNVFILAGGQGVRLDPVTRILPKPLIPLGQKSIIEKIMDQYSLNGFEVFILSLYYKAEIIRAYFENDEMKKKYKSIRYVQEKKPLGTIGSLKLACDMLKDSFFINNSDVLILEDYDKILDFHKKSGGLLTIVGCKKSFEIPYGILKADENGKVTEILEKPSLENLTITGVYVAEPDIIKYIPEEMEFDITTLIKDLMQKGEKVSIYTISEEQWFDTGEWSEYKRTMEKLG